MAKATPAKKAATKKTEAKPAVTRTRKTDEQRLAEAQALIERINAKKAEGDVKRREAQDALDEAHTVAADLMDAARSDASKLPELRKAVVAFSAAVKAAAKLGPLEGSTEEQSEGVTA